MTIRITGTYTGTLKTDLTRGPSGTDLTTAAPMDHQGDGRSFSPTALMASALPATLPYADE